MSEYTEFLIVGGGIAGMCLQLELHKRGKSTVLINDEDRNVSTSIAAGIVNPVAGKFYALTWRANDFFPGLADYYHALESRFDQKFFYAKPLYRILSNAGEQNTWFAKSKRSKYQDYCTFEHLSIPYVQSELGFVRINYGGHLDTNTFLNAAKRQMKEDAVVRNEVFVHSELDVEGKSYRGLKFGQIVFCEGYDMVSNPYFSHLPFTPNKGEVLTIQAPDLDQDKILVGGVFLLPVGNHLFKVGASYDHHDLSLKKTDKNRIYLIERLDKMIKTPYQLVEQLVGLRPAVKDRRPLLGKHPQHNHVKLFNGLGSKGVSTAPVLAKEMADFMLDGRTLHPECNINRFD